MAFCVIVSTNTFALHGNDPSSIFAGGTPNTLDISPTETSAILPPAGNAT